MPYFWHTVNFGGARKGGSAAEVGVAAAGRDGRGARYGVAARERGAGEEARVGRAALAVSVETKSSQIRTLKGEYWGDGVWGGRGGGGVMEEVARVSIVRFTRSGFVKICI